MNDDRIMQIARSHKSARPQPSNPAWVHTHRDLGVALQEIERLTAENTRLKQWFEYHAAVLATHRIGGYEFVDTASTRQEPNAGISEDKLKLGYRSGQVADQSERENR